MEFQNIIATVKRFTKGHLGLSSFLFLFLVSLLGWVIYTSLGAVVEDSAVKFFDSYLADILFNRWVPVWTLCILLFVTAILAFAVGVSMNRQFTTQVKKRPNSNVELFDLRAETTNQLFQDLVEEVEKDPTGLPHGKLWKGLIQVQRKETTEYEFAAKVISMLQSGDINEKTARAFVESVGYSLRKRANEYSLAKVRSKGSLS